MSENIKLIALKDLEVDNIIRIYSKIHEFSSVGIVKKLGTLALQIGSLGASFKDSALCYILYDPKTVDDKVLANVWVFGGNVGPHYGVEQGLSFRSTNLRDTEINLEDKSKFIGWKYYDLESRTIRTVE